jgi:hypothetical protein
MITNPLDDDSYPEKPCPICGSYEPDVVCNLCEHTECDGCADKQDWVKTEIEGKKETVCTICVAEEGLEEVF